MTTLTVRRLLVDLERPIEPRWAGGDAFVTAWFNALSMSFPVGEQLFIDAVRAGLKQLDEATRDRFAAEVQAFIGQEATHRRVHALFNAHLARQGLVNTWEPRAARRIALLTKRGIDVRHWVGITAAIEHFTAILSVYLLQHPEWLEGAEPRLRTLWQWHAAEECEHRSTAFELYRALGGNERWRRRWMRLVTIHFVTDLLRQIVRNLWHDGALWRWSTWRSGVRFLFGAGGLAPSIYRPWRAYFREDFHPREQGGRLGEEWLEAHADQAVPVGSSPG